MAKRYARLNWQNAPSVATPINAANLNIMDKGIDDLDNAIEAQATQIQTLNDNLAGFGLSGEAANVTDWNNAVKNGFYAGYGANGPIDDYLMGFVCNYRDAHTIQMLFSLSPTSSAMYIRHRFNSNWGDWITK